MTNLNKFKLKTGAVQLIYLILGLFIVFKLPMSLKTGQVVFAYLFGISTLLYLSISTIYSSFFLEPGESGGGEVLIFAILGIIIQILVYQQIWLLIAKGKLKRGLYFLLPTFHILAAIIWLLINDQIDPNHLLLGLIIALPFLIIYWYSSIFLLNQLKLPPRKSN